MSANGNSPSSASVQIATHVHRGYSKKNAVSSDQAIDTIRSSLADLLERGTWKKESVGSWVGHDAQRRIRLSSDLTTVLAYTEGEFSPGGSRKKSDKKARLHDLLNSEMDRLPIEVAREAVFAYAHIVTGQKINLTSAHSVFLSMRKNLSEGVIPEWMPFRHHREQMVIPYGGFLWYVKQDLTVRREGVVTRIELDVTR